MDFTKASQMDILTDGNSILNNHDQQSLGLALQPKYVHMVTLDPEDLSPSQLISFMRYMDEYSQVPKTYQLAFGKSRVSIFTHYSCISGLFFYFWSTTSTVDGFPFGDRTLHWFRLLLFTRLLGLRKFGIRAFTSLVCTHAYYFNVWCRKLFTLSGPLN